MRARLLGSVLAAVFSVAVAFGTSGGSGLDVVHAELTVPPDSGWTDVEAAPADSGWTKVLAGVAEIPPDSGWTSSPADAEA